jgi:hypothetical protein
MLAPRFRSGKKGSMTAQISDVIEFEGELYDLAEDHHVLFQPDQYGLSTFFFSTACVRGFHCHYVIEEGLLRLRRLYLGYSEVNARCELGGVLPTYDAELYRFGYEGLSLPVPFSGRLLLGREFISDLNMYDVFQYAWKYRSVIEIVLKEGRVISTTHRSKLIRRIRRFLLRRACELGIEGFMAELDELPTLADSLKGDNPLSAWSEVWGGRGKLPSWIDPGFVQAHRVGMWLLDMAPRPPIRQLLRIISVGPDWRRVVSALKQSLDISSARALLIVVFHLPIDLLAHDGYIVDVRKKLEEAGATVTVKDLGPRVPLDFDAQDPESAEQEKFADSQDGC